MLEVLHVDDSQDFAEICKSHLEEDGEFSVTLASSASEALSILRINDFDAIVSDYQMPEMDGIELLKVIRKAGDRIPFILFTGKGREEVAMEALNSGANFYLMKGADFVPQIGILASQIRIACSQREGEEAVAYNLRRFRTIIENISDILMLLDSEGTILFCSPSVVTVLGFKPEEMIGRNASDFMMTHTNFSEWLSPGAVDQKGAPMWKQIVVPCKDGCHHTFLVAYNVHRDDDGNLQVIMVGRDITDIKRMHEELVSTDEVLKRVMEGLPYSFVVWTALEGKVTIVSETFASRLGYKPDELLGRTAQELGIIDMSDSVALASLLGAEKRIVDTHVNLRHRDGNVIGAKASISLLELTKETKVLWVVDFD